MQQGWIYVIRIIRLKKPNGKARRFRASRTMVSRRCLRSRRPAAKKQHTQVAWQRWRGGGQAGGGAAAGGGLAGSMNTVLAQYCREAKYGGDAELWRKGLDDELKTQRPKYMNGHAAARLKCEEFAGRQKQQEKSPIWRLMGEDQSRQS